MIYLATWQPKGINYNEAIAIWLDVEQIFTGHGIMDVAHIFTIENMDRKYIYQPNQYKEFYKCFMYAYILNIT